MKMKKSYWYGIIALLIIGGYFWYRSTNSASTETRYVTAQAERGTLTTAISSSGNVTIDSEANVDPTITGTVTDLRVKVGDSVKKGDRLFLIDNDDLGVQAAKAKASYLSAQQSLASAYATRSQAKADSYQAQRGDNKSSKMQQNALKKKVDAAEAGVASSVQGLIAAKADYQNVLSEAAERTVKAPIDGTVNEVNVKNGDDLGNLTSSTGGKVTPIIIGDLATLQVSVDVSEVDIATVSLGQKVEITLDALPDLHINGKVSAVDSLGTNSSGVVNYTVTIDFDELDTRMKPGMSVSASIITGVKENTLLVPNSAVKTDANGKYVQVMEQGTPTRKGVTVGASNASETEITSGLSERETVVTQTISAASATPAQTTSPFRLPGTGGNNRSSGTAR
ncbi:MAG: efflux RND transporter periplasmic adaptor subunit [Candidatus Moraniibacteriota bacterium]